MKHARRHRAEEVAGLLAELLAERSQDRGARGAGAGNVYLREADVLPAIDRWPLVIFAPHRLEQTIREMQVAQDTRPVVVTPPGQDTQALIASCDARLARYQAALDAGADPKAVAEWTRQVQAERAAALARDASRDRPKPVASSPRTTSGL